MFFTEGVNNDDYDLGDDNDGGTCHRYSDWLAPRLARVILTETLFHVANLLLAIAKARVI